MEDSEAEEEEEIDELDGAGDDIVNPENLSIDLVAESSPVPQGPVPRERPQRNRRQPRWMAEGDYVVGKFGQQVPSMEMFGHMLETYSTTVMQIMSNCK